MKGEAIHEEEQSMEDRQVTKGGASHEGASHEGRAFMRAGQFRKEGAIREERG